MLTKWDCLVDEDETTTLQTTLAKEYLRAQFLVGDEVTKVANTMKADLDVFAGEILQQGLGSQDLQRRARKVQKTKYDQQFRAAKLLGP